MTKFQSRFHKDNNLHSLLRVMRRQKILIFCAAIIGITSSVFMLQHNKQIYTAHAQIIYDNKNSTYIKTQYALISSPQIIQSVIYDLGLMHDPDFASKTTKIGQITTKLRRNFSAIPVHDSYILNINYTGHNKKKTVKILNKIIEYYIESLTQNNIIPIDQHEKKTIKRLQDNVEEALDNLQHVKKQIDMSKPTHYQNQPTPLYEAAQINYSMAKDKLSPFLKNGKITINRNATEIINSDSIQKLKIKRRYIQQELSSLSTRYGAKHPKIIAIKSRGSIIDNLLNEEMNNIIMRIKSDYDTALTQLQNIKNPTKILSPQYYSIEKTKLSLAKEQAETAIQIYREYENAYKKYKKEQSIKSIPAKILTRANIEQTPAYPQKIKNVGIATLISLILGILIAIFIEKARNTLLSGRQLENLLDLPCYALIPKAKKDKDKPLAHFVMDNPSSSISESVRALRLVLKLRAGSENKETKVITITSSFPNEGKTTLSSWMAQLAAKSGERVILIDADLRRPSIHKSFGRKNTLSLVEYLGGKNKLEEIIDTNDKSGLHIIFGRTVPNSALDLVSSDKMDALIRSLRKAYDLIIIDSPACMAVADARALEKLSDQLIYAVQWNKTSREVVHNGISQFSQFGKAHIATVLTNIDLKKHVKFGYGEAINYYGDYKECSAA